MKPDQFYFPMSGTLGKVFQPADAYQGTRLSTMEALYSGITTVTDWSHNNLTREHATGAGIAPGMQVELELAGERVFAIAARTFADARPGDIILYEDSYRNMSLAISGGSAAEMLHARAGQSLRINVLQP